MKHLLVGVGIVAAAAAPTIATVSTENHSNDVSPKNLNKKIEYFYNGKIYESKDLIYKEYMLAHPGLIKQKNVVGDVDESIIDFDSNMLNISDLPDFDSSKIHPVYKMPDGSYEQNFDRAQKSQVNLALTTNDYTDGFNNFFKLPSEAKNSYGNRVFSGDVATNDFPMADGRNIEYNPLSEQDTNSIQNQSLNYLQTNGSVLENDYNRGYFKDGKKINSFYDFFKSAQSVKSDTNSMLSRYTLMQAVNNTKTNGTDMSANIYSSNINNEDALNQVNVDTSQGLSGFASDANLTQYSQDIYKRRTDLAQEVKENNKANADFISNHANDKTPIKINGSHNKSSYRYKFLNVKVINNAHHGQRYDGDKDAGDAIYFNGHLQSHKASFYQRYVGWDGEADSQFRGYYYALNFHDNFTNKDDCVVIWLNMGEDTDGCSDEDYASYSILNNKIFNRTVPVWGGRTTTGQKAFWCNWTYNSPNHPWIMGNHDIDSYSDNEWGTVLHGFSKNQIVNNFNPFIFNGAASSTIIHDYEVCLFKYLNNVSKQPVLKKQININAKKVYMTKHDLDECINSPSKLSNYVKVSNAGNDSVTNTWVKNVSFQSMKLENNNTKIVASYKSQGISPYTFPAGKIEIPINIKHDYSIDNNLLNKKSKELYDPDILGNFKIKDIFNSSTFNTGKSILSTDNNKITLSYDQYESLISGLKNNDPDWNNIYIDVVSKDGMHIPYLLDLKSLINDPKNRIFSNLLDSKNIEDIDRKNNISLTIDFSKINFIKNGIGKVLSGIHLKWNLINPYTIKGAPTKLEMKFIDNQPIDSNSLVLTIQKLLKRKEEYILSPETINCFNDFIRNYDKLIQEKISYKDIPVFDLERDTSNLNSNNIDSISLIKSNYNINTLFSSLENKDVANQVINAYNNGYLEEFKELIRNAVLSPMDENNKISYSYVLTLQNYIKNSSISGQLPSEQKFKIPTFDNLLIIPGKSTVKHYVVLNQYSFNGSLLTSELTAIGKGNLFGQSDSLKLEQYKKNIIKSFNPPRITRLYDINGKPFQIDNTGSSLYDDEETVVANALLKAVPERVNGMVFYDGLPKPILGQVSMIYFTEIGGEKYYFKDSDSIKNFIKGYLDSFIQIIEGGSYD